MSVREPTRFRMNHEKGALEIVGEDDRVLRMWPAVVAMWDELDFDSGTKFFRSRAVRVVSEAGWYVVVVWGTFTFSSNFALSPEVPTPLDQVGFIEEPETVECQVCADDEHDPYMVFTHRKKVRTADTLVPYVNTGQFEALMRAVEEFFDRWGPLPGSNLAIHVSMADLDVEGEE